MLTEQQLIDQLITAISFMITIGVPYCVLVWATLKILDWSAGVSWGRHVYEKIKENPDALARYYGLRMQGVCVGLGLVVGLVASTVHS